MFRMSEKSRIRIKKGSLEFEIEGTNEFVQSYVGNNFSEIINNIEQLADVHIEEETDTEKPDKKPIPSYPQISGVSGLADALRRLLSTEWGKNPHTSGEIREVLQLNALHYESRDIGSQLSKMIKNGEIRRIGERGNYQYIGK